MDEILKKYQEILDAVRYLEQTGTMRRFLRDIPPADLYDKEVDLLVPCSEVKYNDIANQCNFQSALHLQQAYRELTLMKRYADYPKALFDDYAPRIKKIKNPDMVNYVKDYRKAHYKKNMLKEKE